MTWYQIILNFLTICVEIVVCLFLISELLKLPKLNLKAVLLSLPGASAITALSLVTLSQFNLIAAKVLVLAVIAYCLFREEMRLSLFLIYFFEIGITLWEFLFSTSLAIVFHSEQYMDRNSPEYLIPSLVVHLLLLGITFPIYRKRGTGKKLSFRFPAMLMLLGMFGLIALSGQHTVFVSDDQLTTWIILSLITFLSVLLFNMRRQYEMEKEIARLKTEQAELLERDYQTLRNVYSTNAKLYHDLHNHLEIMYRYLSNNQTADATKYLENLRTPIRELTQAIWTGDDAVDYLISSKLSLATQAGVTVNTNIEFPRNTNISSTDMVAILGNLLDNAIEATQKMSDELRYVSLTMRRINDMLIIKVENGCDTAPMLTAGAIQTTKADRNLHGWGIQSIRAAVEHYDGTIEISYDKNIFYAVATLFYQAKKNE